MLEVFAIGFINRQNQTTEKLLLLLSHGNLNVSLTRSAVPRRPPRGFFCFSDAKWTWSAFRSEDKRKTRRTDKQTKTTTEIPIQQTNIIKRNDSNTFSSRSSFSVDCVRYSFSFSLDVAFLVSQFLFFFTSEGNKNKEEKSQKRSTRHGAEKKLGGVEDREMKCWLFFLVWFFNDKGPGKVLRQEPTSTDVGLLECAGCSGGCWSGCWGGCWRGCWGGC